MRRLGPLLIALVLAPAGARAAEAVALVASVVDGDTVVLEGAGGDEVRLVGIQAPKLALGRAGFRAWPLADQSKAALAALVLGQPVGLAFGGRRMDRHGRLLAHMVGDDGTWVQGALLGRGMARLCSFADNRAAVPSMLAQERDARARGLGIWGHEFYRLRTPDDVAGHTGTFQIVEGTVLAAARVKGRVYLNFGADWRTDFTVSLDRRARRLFRQAGIDPLALAGRRLRVRGWVRRFNGPLIEATHPEQIEVLGP